MKIKKYIMVSAITCPKCNDTIFSRTRHDYHGCSCGGYAIDGGFDYVKTAWQTELPIPVHKRIRVYATKAELYDDWNKRIDKFGTIKKKK